MEKPIIGIISDRNIDNSGSQFQNTTNFSDLVVEKIVRFNGIPIEILTPNHRLNLDALNICDGLVLQGENKVEPSKVVAAYRAINSGIPVLGICNGMQAIAAIYIDVTGKPLGISPIQHIAQTVRVRGERGFLYPVAGHNKVNPFNMQNIENAKHEIKILKSSRLYDIVRKEKMSVVSTHSSSVQEGIIYFQNDFIVCARSSDREIEAIEIKNPDYFCLGVQYHIELDDENDNIFNEFIKESNKTMKLKR